MKDCTLRHRWVHAEFFASLLFDYFSESIPIISTVTMVYWRKFILFFTSLSMIDKVVGGNFRLEITIFKNSWFSTDKENDSQQKKTVSLPLRHCTNRLFTYILVITSMGARLVATKDRKSLSVKQLSCGNIKIMKMKIILLSRTCVGGAKSIRAESSNETLKQSSKLHR